LFAAQGLKRGFCYSLVFLSKKEHFCDFARGKFVGKKQHFNYSNARNLLNEAGKKKNKKLKRMV
jgi:hypothetical protein